MANDLLSEITPEMEKEVQAEISSAQGPEGDKPVSFAKPTPTEMEAKASTPEPEPKLGEKKLESAAKLEAKASESEPKSTQAQEKPKPSREPEWLKTLPDDAQKHVKGLFDEIARVRVDRTKTRKESELAVKKLSDELSEVRRLLTPAKTAPDPTEDPDGYTKHLEAENKAVKETLGEIEKRDQEEQQVQETVKWMGENEEEFIELSGIDRKEYDAAIKFTYEHAVQSLMDEHGFGEQAAVAQVKKNLLAKAKELQAVDGSVARWAWNHAKRIGFTGAQPAGNGAGDPAGQPKKTALSDADSISRGQTQAAPQAKGGGAIPEEELTWESLSKIKDGNEHAKAMDRLLQKLGVQTSASLM